MFDDRQVHGRAPARRERHRRSLQVRKFDEPAGREAPTECRGACPLYADDANAGLHSLGRDRDAGNQTPAANCDEQGVEIWRVSEDFETDSSLTGNDIRIGKGVKVGAVLGLGMPEGRLIAVVPAPRRSPHERPSSRAS